MTGSNKDAHSQWKNLTDRKSTNIATNTVQPWQHSQCHSVTHQTQWVGGVTPPPYNHQRFICDLPAGQLHLGLTNGQWFGWAWVRVGKIKGHVPHRSHAHISDNKATWNIQVWADDLPFSGGWDREAIETRKWKLAFMNYRSLWDGKTASLGKKRV